MEGLVKLLDSEFDKFRLEEVEMEESVKDYVGSIINGSISTEVEVIDKNTAILRTKLGDIFNYAHNDKFKKSLLETLNLYFSASSINYKFYNFKIDSKGLKFKVRKI